MPREARALVHHGSVVAHGMLLVGHDAAGARLLPLLQGGEQLTWADDALFVRFATPRRLRVEQSEGYVVCEQHGLYATFPLARAAVPHHVPGSLLWLRGGELVAVAPHAMTPCDPGSFLELGEVELVRVEPPPRGPDVRPPPATTDDARAVLGVAALSDEARAVHAALSTGPSNVLARPSLLARLFGWLRHRASSVQERAGSQRSGTRPSLLSRLGHAAFSMLSGLGLLWLWALPHERYLRRLSDLFERGDIMEALRHALPLGTDGAPGSEARVALRPPGRREQLDMLGQRGDGSVLPLGGDAIQHLRALYQSALKRLEREGQIEQAAFVLAELLRDVSGAIALLERHGKLRLAAELADSRDVAVGERVRLWFLAGEVDRALRLAVLHGAYADAVERLQKRMPEAADRLRLLWAHHTASAGDYLQAARVAWSVAGARNLVQAWLELATRAEGPSAHTAWVLRLVLVPGLAPEGHAALAGVISAEHADAAAERAALAAELTSQSAPVLEPLVAPLLRAMLHEGMRGTYPHTASVIQELLKRAPVLRGDWPRAEGRDGQSTLRSGIGLARVTLRARDRGTLAMHDAVPLPGGRMLVALGSLGAMLLSRRGAVLAHWERLPVEVIVPATHGSRALLLARGGDLMRAARLDLATRKLERWFDLPLTSYARSYDGHAWDVVLAEGDSTSTYARLDAVASEPHALFQVRPGGPVLMFHASGSASELVVATPHALEQWSYELPASTLRARAELPAVAETAHLALAEGGRLLVLERDEASVLKSWRNGTLESTRALPATLALADPALRFEQAHPWLWTVRQTSQGPRVDVLDARTCDHVVELHFEGATRVTVRVGNGLLLACDDLGRIIRRDLTSGQHALFRL